MIQINPTRIVTHDKECLWILPTWQNSNKCATSQATCHEKDGYCDFLVHYYRRYTIVTGYNFTTHKDRHLLQLGCLQNTP